MCGIAGFIGYPDNRQNALDANEIQKHRGPDYQGVWCDDHIALAHQRLSIIDLSDRSNQPMTGDNLVIVFNGEIYNYRQLREMLRDKHAVDFKTESDTEVVLEAYRLYGNDCVDLFTGMFAFAIYNKDDSSIFLARDHYGIKPLFYSAANDRFAFASELKTLASGKDFDKRINYSALVASLNYLWIPGNDTMFLDAGKLPPGHYMTVDRLLNIKITRYLQDSIEDLVEDEEEAIAMLTGVFTDSIERHMVADVPVSSFLSGGLDSSLISAVASTHTKKLSTYTIASSREDKKIEQMPDDEIYARKLAEQFHFDHHEICIDSNIVNTLPKIVRMLDEPIGDPAAINTHLICNEARKKGVKVLLSGMGADEIFFGYRRQKATLMAMKYRRVVPAVMRKFVSAVVDRLPVRFMGRGLRLVRWSKKFLSFTELSPGRSYMQSYSYYNQQELGALLKGGHGEEIESLYENHDRIFFSAYKNDPVNQMCNTDIHMFMVGLNLTYTDRASMASSVEVRVPFIDREVIRAAMSLDGSLKYHGGESKYILKKVAEKFLPREIIYRPKASFGAPIRSWISGALKDMVDDLLSKDNIEKRGLFDSAYVRGLIEDDRRGVIDNAYRIYQLLTLELWFREFVDQPA